MIPLRVSLEGFLSYKDKQVIDFEGSSLWMLWGPNGVGKSAVFDAITFALYGYHRAGGGNPKALINHYANDNRFIVEFDFLVDGVAYRIRRTCGRLGRSTREAFIIHRNNPNEPDKVTILPVLDTDNDSGFKKWVQRTIGLDYSAFTSSVLLLQGKSEQLLNADPKDRYTILAELIDLSRYQRLHEAADSQRMNFKRSIDALEKQMQLEAVRVITDEEIATARFDVEQAEERWGAIQLGVSRLTTLLEQAKQWKQLISQLEKQLAELQNEAAVLARADEITLKFVELQALRQVLPSLNQIVDKRGSILVKTQSITDLERKKQCLEADLAKAKSDKEQADQQRDQHARVLENLQKTRNKNWQRLNELIPLVTRLENIEGRKAEIEQLEIDLAAFPPDLTQLLEDAEQQDSVLTEKEKAFPWLKTFAQARTDFETALGRERTAHAQADILHGQLQDHKNKRFQHDIELTAAKEAERNLLKEKTGADHRYKDIVKRLKSFENAATKPVCDLCGQIITEDHVQREKTRLQQQVVEIKQAFEQLDSSHRQSHERQESMERELATLDEQIADLIKRCHQSEAEQRYAQEQATGYVGQLQKAFTNIQSPFKDCIITAVPTEDTAWLETVYPTEADLETLRRDLEGQKVHKGTLKRLRDEHSKWEKLDGQKALVQQQLEQLTQVTNLEQARSARDEKNIIKEKQQTLDLTIKQEEQVYDQETLLAQQASDKVEQCREQLQTSYTLLEAERASCREMEHTLQALMGSLPENWRMRAEVLDADELKVLEQQRNALAEYEDLHEKLGHAHQSKVMHEQSINELNGRIASYEQAARRPASEIEQELNNKNARLKETDDERNSVRERLTRMEEQQKRRWALEEQKREADRYYHLYKILTDLLGRNGLQLYLLNRAESALVILANITLNGLSHGRMRLELRRDSDTATTQKEKALDLVVYDRDTGQHPIPINLVSGSQRFRIAVSLALAIGRYTSQEARRIESVIIDEGFGSLDKAGRDDMIQELSNLGQQLARIILVSHQEDFANAFPNRYSFKLIDKASYVTLMEEDE